VEELFISGVSDKFTSMGEFSEFMSDFIFSDKDRNMLFPVMHSESVSDELRSDRARSGPCFDDIFSTTFVHYLYLFRNTRIDIWSFLEATCHKRKLKIYQRSFPARVRTTQRVVFFRLRVFTPRARRPHGVFGPLR
jgi:hypothetical protein